MMKKIISFVLVLFFILIFSSFVSAECPPDCGYEDPLLYDTTEIYSYSESYQNNDFYLNSDPGYWDTSQVDFTNPEIWNNPNIENLFDNEELYSDSNFYESFEDMPGDMYSKVDWTSFDFSNEEFSFSDVEWESVLCEKECNENIQEFHNNIASNTNGALDKYKEDYLSEGQELEIDDRALEKARFGQGEISVLNPTSGTYLGWAILDEHPGATFVAGKRGIKIIYSDSSLFNPGGFNEHTDARFEIISSEGITYNGIHIEGNPSEPIALDYNHNGWNVPPGEIVTINGIEIQAHQPVNIYGFTDDPTTQDLRTLESSSGFEFIHHNLLGESNPSIYFGENGFVASQYNSDPTSDQLTRDAFKLSIQPDNSYGIPVEPKSDGILGWGEQDYDDHLVIIPRQGSFVYTSSEEGDGQAQVYGRVDVENGHREVTFDTSVYSKAVMYDEVITKGSVPLDVEVYDIEGNNVYTQHDISNEVSFGDNQDLNLGQPPVSHFSIKIDPHNMIEPGEGKEITDTVDVINNLFLSGAKQPYIIVKSPAEDQSEQVTWDRTAEIISSNVPPSEIPMAIQLESQDETEVSSNELFYSKILNPERTKNPLTSNSQGELYSSVSLKIIGHSGGVDQVNYMMPSKYKPVGDETFSQIEILMKSRKDERLVKVSKNGMTYLIGETSHISYDTKLVNYILSEESSEYFESSFDYIGTVKTGTGADDEFKFLQYNSKNKFNPFKDSMVGCAMAHNFHETKKGELLYESANGGVIVNGELITLQKGNSEEEVIFGEAEYYFDGENYKFKTSDEKKEILNQELQRRLNENEFSKSVFSTAYQEIEEQEIETTKQEHGIRVDKLEMAGTVGVKGNGFVEIIDPDNGETKQIFVDYAAPEALAVIDILKTRFPSETYGLSMEELVGLAKEKNLNGELIYDCSIQTDYPEDSGVDVLKSFNAFQHLC